MFTSQLSRLLFTLLFSVLLMSTLAFGDATAIGYQYIHPGQGARYVNPQSNIALRLSDASPANLPEAERIQLHGSESGELRFELRIATDNRTLIVEPEQQFLPGERVSLLVLPGDRWPELELHFDVSQRGVEPFPSELEWRTEIFPRIYAAELGLEPGQALPEPTGPALASRSELDEPHLPSYFPEMNWTVNGPSSRNYVYANISNYPWGVYFRAILSTDGQLVRWQEMDWYVFNYRFHENEQLASWCETATRTFYLENLSGEIVEEVHAGNGYASETDFHELLLLPEGHRALIIYDVETVDMSELVPDGDPEADVVGVILQELDANGDVIFEWRSWDHFQITDAAEEIDLTASQVDYVHSNSIEVDTDGNWIISSRHLSEVTKINRSTGDVMWRMSGENNQFTFINDPDSGFSGQHDARRLDNGNLLVFDNGHWNDDPGAASKEYLVDESNLTAELVWQYESGNVSTSQGSNRRQADGNTIIGWGRSTGQPLASEVDGSGNPIWEMSIPFEPVDNTSFHTYRTQPADTQATMPVPYLSAETFKDGSTRLFFDHFGRHDTDHYEVYVSTVPDPTNAVDVTDRFYDIPNAQAGQDYYARVKSVDTTGAASDFSEQLHIAAGTVDAPESDMQAQPGSPVLLEVYPNPFNPSATVAFELAQAGELRVAVYDLLGRYVTSLADGPFAAGRHTVNFDGSRLPSGSYIIEARAGDHTPIRQRVTLLK